MPHEHLKGLLGDCNVWSKGPPFAISVKGTDLVLRACDSSHRLGNCWQDHLPLPTEKVVQKRFGAELARSIHHLNLCKFWLCFLPVDNIGSGAL